MCVGEGWLALLPSHLPQLRELCLEGCYNVCDKYVEELMTAVPELKVIRYLCDNCGSNEEQTNKKQ